MGAGGCWCRLLGKVDEKYAQHHHQRGTKKLLSMKNMTAFGKNNLRGSARVPCLKIRFTSVSLYYGKHTQKCLDFRMTRFICEFY